MTGRGRSLRRFVFVALSVSCGALQVTPLRLRTAAPPSPHILRLTQPPKTLLTAVHLTSDDAGTNTVSNVGRKNVRALSKFVGRMKRALSVGLRSRSALSFVLALSVFLMTLFPRVSLAVQSGGRMGGSFGRGSSRRESSSRSYAAAPGRSFSHGGGYPRGFGRGCSSGYSPRPNLIISPRVGHSPFYSPYYAPSPGARVAVANLNPLRGFLFTAGFFLLASYLSSVADDVRSRSRGALGPGVSVAEISVALDVPDRDSPSSVLVALSRLSRTARTDSRAGLQRLTSQVALELLRRKASVVAAATIATHHWDGDRARREYDSAAIRQRGKFERETLSKYGGVDETDYQAAPTQSGYQHKATLAVVTIIMMIDGDRTSKQLSSNVNSMRDVEEALTCIAADVQAEDCLRGAEILWCPEQRKETLTMKDVLADYPNLRSI